MTSEAESDPETPLAFCTKLRKSIPLSRCASCDAYEPAEGEEPGAPCRHLAPPEEAEEPESPAEELDSEPEAEETEQETPPLASYCNLHEREVTGAECQGCRDFDRSKDSGLCWHVTFKPDSDEDEESDQDDSD